MTQRQGRGEVEEWDGRRMQGATTQDTYAATTQYAPMYQQWGFQQLAPMQPFGPSPFAQPQYPPPDRYYPGNPQQRQQ
jgi:hypothetical protein